MEDKTYENEVEAPSPMVQISLREYDKLKDNQKYSLRFSQIGTMTLLIHVQN